MCQIRNGAPAHPVFAQSQQTDPKEENCLSGSVQIRLESVKPQPSATEADATPLYLGRADTATIAGVLAAAHWSQSMY